MATSRILLKTAGTLVEEALRDARIIAAEQPINDIDRRRGFDSLNNVVKYWQSQDLNLWLKEEAVLPLNVGQALYLLGPNGAECADANNFFDTSLTAALVTNDLVVTVSDTTGMISAPNTLESDPTQGTTGWTPINNATLAAGLIITNVGATQGGADFSLPATPGETYRVHFTYTLGTSVSCTFSVLNGTTVADTVTLNATGSTFLTITAINDTITFRAQNDSAIAGQDSTVSNLQYIVQDSGSRVGIELDDGTRFWGDVYTVDSSTQFTMVSGITGAAAINNTVYSYTEKLSRPMRLLNVRYADNLAASEIPTNRWSRQEYFEQPDKRSQGTITQWYYSPQIKDGEFYVWQVANSVNSVARISYVKPALVYSEVEDELEPPSEWYMPLKWAIAEDIAPSYGISGQRLLEIRTMAEDSLEKVLAHDNEYSSLYFQPDYG